MRLRCLLPAAFLLAGCSTHSEDAAKVNLHGAVQKGPFVIGSTIEVSLLDDQLNPTGQVFNTQTVNDRGEFDIAFSSSSPVALKGVGFYYNEASGALSGSSITLRAFFVPSAAGAQTAYVNLITHLTTQRIMALVRGGKPFADSVRQSEDELRRELGITPPSYVPGVAGIAMNVAGGDGDDNAYLLAVSATFAQAAAAKGSSLDANLQELINSAAIDLEDGALSEELKSMVRQAAATLDVQRIHDLLAARLNDIGAGGGVPDMNRVLDQDFDGLANLRDGCPRAANPLQEDGDKDGVGDACDPCPETPCPHGCLPRSAAAGLNADLCYTPCTRDSDCNGAERCARSNVLGGVSFCALPCDPLASACTTSLGCFFVELASSASPDKADGAGSGAGADGGSSGSSAGGADGGRGGEGTSAADGGSGGGGAMGSAFVCAAGALFSSAAEGEVCSGKGLASPMTSGVGCGEGLFCARAPGDAYVCRKPCDTAHPNCDGAPCVASSLDGFAFCQLPPGMDGDGCDPDTCAQGLSCVDGWLGCPAGLSHCCRAVGSPGELCKPDRTCNDGLSCVEDGCPGAGSQRKQCCMHAGGLDEPCDSMGNCEQDLACTFGSAGFCPNGGSRCCKHSGDANEPCEAMGRCNGALVCATSTSCPNMGPCCLSAGGPGEPCEANGSCSEPGYGCGAGDSCTAAGLTRCCVPSGGEKQPCLSDRTCKDATLSCVMSGGPSGMACASSECCLLAGDLYQACNAQGPACRSVELGCGSAPTDARCLYGLDRCCVPAGGENQPCRSTTETGDRCVDPSLSCQYSTNCSAGTCCIKAGKLGQPCRQDDPSKQCDLGLACAYNPAAMSGICVEAGGLNEPCRPWSASGSRCDSGLGCSMASPGEGEKCIPAGGQGQLCLENSKCSEGWLACGSSASCPAGAMQCCYRIPSGAKDQPCGPGDACNSSLHCTSLSCPNGLAKCCELPFAACTGEGCAEASQACVQSSQCAPLTSCCAPAGEAYQPCQAGDSCNNPSLTCAASNACPAGLGKCCLYSGQIDQPCQAGGTCYAGFCVSSSSCPNGLASCCKAAPACSAQGTCGEPDTICAFSSKCRSGMNIDQCCVPSGGRDQACGPQHTCAQQLSCVQDPAQCPNGLQECCR